MTPAEIRQAALDGRNAEPGARNPYAGTTYVAARAWLLGYQAMMRQRIDATPSRRAYLDAQK